MSRADPAQLEKARRLLAHEGAAGRADKSTTAAARVYDKLRAHLGLLVGDLGVRLLFVRSARLAQGEFATFAEVTGVEASTMLREYLQKNSPAVAAESAAVLFGTFFTLIHTFIGERLTTEVLRTAWPMFDTAPAEKTK